MSTIRFQNIFKTNKRAFHINCNWSIFELISRANNSKFLEGCRLSYVIKLSENE